MKTIEIKPYKLTLKNNPCISEPKGSYEYSYITVEKEEKDSDNRKYWKGLGQYFVKNDVENEGVGLLLKLAYFKEI